MSFLDEATIETTPEKLAAVKKAASDDDTIKVTEKKKKRPDYADVDGDGDKTEPMAKAFKDKEKGDVEEGKLSKTLGGIAVLATLLGINKAASEKIYNSDPKIKALTSQYEKAKEDGDKEAMAKFEKEIERRKVMWDTGKVDEAKTVELPADTTFTLDLKHLMKKHLDEGKSQEEVVKLTKALMKKLHDKGEVKVNGTKVIFKESTNQEYLVYYQVGSWGVSRNERVKASSPEEAIAIVTRKVKNDGNYITPNTWNGDPVISAKPITNEASVMGVPLESFADYYTALELAKNVGVPVVAFSALLAIMGVKKATEFLKKGKEAVMAWYEQNKLNEQEDAQLALPEPPARDYLGDDGKDYEGGMAKSQLLKMKKYAMALCDMVDDESQLEAWVQSKITKASDYMSAVYHYLDYQNQKDERPDQGAY